MKSWHAAAVVAFAGLALGASASTQEAPPRSRELDCLWQFGTAIQPVQDELKKLQPLIGEWDSEITTGTGPLTDKSTKWKTSPGKMSIRWILDGRYLHVAAENGDDRFLWIIGYDAENKRYRRLAFTNAGQISESHGQWNDEFESIDWKMLNEPPGPRKRGQDYMGLDAVARGQGKEILAISILSSDDKGTLYQDFGSRSTRRK